MQLNDLQVKLPVSKTRRENVLIKENEKFLILAFFFLFPNVPKSIYNSQQN